MSHFTDTHHAYFPAHNYSQGVAKVFRELPENKEQLCRNEHNEIHATTEPPEKPERLFMIHAIARQMTRDLEALNEQQEVV